MDRVLLVIGLLEGTIYYNLSFGVNIAPEVQNMSLYNSQQYMVNVKSHFIKLNH